MNQPEEVLRRFRAGELSAEEAAELLLPTLKQNGQLSLEVTEADMPLLHALQHLAKPNLPPMQPLEWDSDQLRGLPRIPDSFWPQIQEHGMHESPHCLNYVFLVGSNLAADLLTQQIESSSNHTVMTDLPPTYDQFCGRLFGRTQPKLLTREDLVELVEWLAGFSPVADAMLDEVNVSGAPAEEPGEDE